MVDGAPLLTVSVVVASHVTSLLCDLERSCGRRLTADDVTRQRPAEARLGQHECLIDRRKVRRVDEHRFGAFDEVARSVLHRQRRDERQSQGNIRLSAMAVSEHGFSARCRVGHIARAQQRLDQLCRHEISIGVTARQERLGSPQEFDTRRRRASRRVSSSAPQPLDRLEVAAGGAEHDVVGHP